MARSKELTNLIKKANRRIEWIESGEKNLFPKQSRAEADALRFKLGKLNNVNSGKIRIGGLMAEDEQKFIDAINNFLDNPITSYKGQTSEMMDKGYETFTQDHYNVSRETYEGLVVIWESDAFQKFKENFGTYSNVIDEMAKNPKSYKKAINMLAGVNRSNKTNGKYATNGDLNVKAFIDRWREL